MKLRHQQGAALVVGLLLLLILSLIGVTGMSSVVLQERMAGGLKNASMAYLGAESALRQGEVAIHTYAGTTGDSPLPEGASFTVYNSMTKEFDVGVMTVADFRAGASFYDGGGTLRPGGTSYAPDMSNMASSIGSTTASKGDLTDSPSFIIEYLEGYGLGDPTAGGGNEGGTVGATQQAFSETPFVYRVTGRAPGGIETISSAVQSIYVIYNRET